MAENHKRYYWLKLKEDFFRDKVMKKLRRIAGGDTYVIIYLKMMLLSITNGGTLVYEGIEEDFPSELALDLDEDPENVQVAVAFLLQNGKLQQVSEFEFYLPDASLAIGSESASAERMRRLRAKASQCDINVRESDTEIEIEKDREIEKENLSIYLRCSENSTFQQSSGKPTLDEVRTFAAKEHIPIDVQRFYDYYEAHGWQTKNGQPIKNWKSTLEYWGRSEGSYHPSKKKEEYPECENAEAYRSLIYNLKEE